jgi:hypothetical protein
MMGKLFKEYHGEEINKLVGAFFIEKNNAIIHFLEESYHQEFFELNFEFDTCDKFHFPFDKFWSFTLYLKSQSFLKMKEINEPEKMIWWLSSKEEFINGYSNKREKVVTVINPLTHLEICEMEREF